MSHLSVLMHQIWLVVTGVKCDLVLLLVKRHFKTSLSYDDDDILKFNSISTQYIFI